MRYEAWRSADHLFHVLAIEGRWEHLPLRIRNSGPCSGAGRGRVEDLKDTYRLLLLEQGFVVFHRRPSAMRLERHRHKVAIHIRRAIGR